MTRQANILTGVRTQSAFEFGGYSAARWAGFDEGTSQTIGQFTPAALSLGMMGASSALGRLGTARGSANAGVLLGEPASYFQNPAVAAQFTFRSVGSFSAAEIAAARSGTLFARFRLWFGRGQYAFSGKFAAARPLMANLTLALNKEVGLVKLANGRTMIVVGKEGEIVLANIRGVVADAIAHTHPSGILVPSGDLRSASGIGDMIVWDRRGQQRAYLVGPDGSAVRWESPSGWWGTDISGEIFPR